MQTSAGTNEYVMVIDDDVVMRELLTLLLDAEGRTVLTAESGEAALALLKGLEDGPPSFILSDLRMPGLSGAALGSRIRRICPLPTLLIAMSGSEPPDGIARPFNAFLRKPFTVAELDETLQQARAKAPGKQNTRTRQPRRGVVSTLQASAGNRAEAKDPVPEIAPLDETIYAKLLSVMGAAQLPQLYTLFMDDVPERLTRMRAAAAVNDAATFAREAHAIKGGCGMLGATEIHAFAGKMEAGGLACSPLLDDFQSAFERLRRILEERMMIV